MSIKGVSSEIFIGKSEVNLIDSKKKRYKIQYDDLDKIDYWLSDKENGKLIFITKNKQKYCFEYRDTVNDTVLKAIDYIKDKKPELTIELLSEELRHKSKVRKKASVKIKRQKCKNCGKEYDSGVDICPYCNYSNTDTHFKWLFIGMIATFFIAIIGFAADFFLIAKPASDVINEIISSTQSPQPETTSIDEIITEAFSTTLTAGHYVVGIDIPVGTYSFFSKKGSGNLISSDGSINEIFDYDSEVGNNLKEYGIENFGTEELHNIFLPEETIVTVTGTQEVSAGCDDGLVSKMKKRHQENLSELEIGYGNYGANENIPAGTYNIIWLEGAGNIISESSNSDNGINEIMGDLSKLDTGDESNDMIKELNDKLYIKEFHNFIIEEGDILKIPDIKVKLIPSE
ncbi:hypothetical protein CE91St54_10040 [Hungatella hathewayi]|jgi:hypothetical protein|uniref:Uncharacterized protein n=1 Tax=Hungatella hathewayi TaxID=154046 RepID=A0AA37JD01_9FIRM|nr:zinc ribbon domain-containing protein [Hungatella hathewayi]GKG99072.1 hypothetical protein CE91St55_10540 [Hungatella hathewayi]GKH05896.1 hypothetical protein CE91St54_10040 [Hungatella hathewayi]DAL75998.1 MAG TPA: zinc-ribbon containing domain protein [Caudoviricetes sp.]